MSSSSKDLSSTTGFLGIGFKTDDTLSKELVSLEYLNDWKPD